MIKGASREEGRKETQERAASPKTRGEMCGAECEQSPGSHVAETGSEEDGKLTPAFGKRWSLVVTAEPNRTERNLWPGAGWARKNGHYAGPSCLWCEQLSDPHPRSFSRP